MNKRNAKPLAPTNADKNSTLAAVAFQDHIIRTMCLKDLNSTVPSRVIHKQRPAKEIKAVVDSGLTFKKRSTQHQAEADKEYVLDPKPEPTLAQRMGLVECAPPAMTETEWRMAKERSNERDDSKQPCVICKELFGRQQQVLLSCSHVFHRACLEAFERFSGKKCCPLCRQEQYQKRLIHEGSKQYRHHCASKIQALWRGYVVRCWYRKLRETIPPKDPKLRRIFYEDRLKTITDRMIRTVEDVDVNGFLNELDYNLKQSREVFNEFDRLSHPLSDEEWFNVQMKIAERGNMECPICLTQLEDLGIKPVKSLSGKPTASTTAVAAATVTSSHTKMVSKNHSAARKCVANETAAQKSISDKKSANEQGVETTRRRCKAILSCCHIFHQTCLEAFEQLTIGERQYCCPVCRSHYQKLIV